MTCPQCNGFGFFTEVSVVDGKIVRNGKVCTNHSSDPASILVQDIETESPMTRSHGDVIKSGIVGCEH